LNPIPSHHFPPSPPISPDSAHTLPTHIHLFDWLNDLFHRINEDFNGEIFKPHLSESIKIDSDVLARIIERLYPPQSPYRFDVIGVELLGSIYERYLGKTIRPTAKTVRVEEKPEVRKAGGVYYTPKYIVDYIVKNTVGKVLEGKTPKQIEKIRILDPACGSGSFLIGAFQYLIDYHVRYLTAHPKEAHIHPLFPDLIRDGNPSADGPRLSVRLKARILRHNLYGVDIDPQAVEITMMSLYLKALEGEKSQLPPKQSLLPELKYNIICGNSLIGPDIYDQGTLFADEERDRINAFDWYADHGVRELAPAFEGGGKPPHSKPAVIDRRYSTQREIAATDAAIGRSLLNAHLFSHKGIRRGKKHPASGSNLKCAFTWQRMAEFIHGFHMCHPIDGMLSFVQRSPVAPGQHLHRVESLPLRYVHISSSHVLIVRRSPAAGADRNAFRILSVRMGYRGRALAWGPNHSQPRGTRSGAQPASAPPQL
jgi:hypothetical protein